MKNTEDDGVPLAERMSGRTGNRCLKASEWTFLLLIRRFAGTENLSSNYKGRMK